MPSRWGSHLKCDVCGLTYMAMRTGDTFASIKAEMWVSSDDPADWVYRRRCGVLRFWHKKKLRWWRYHVAQCESAMVEGAYRLGGECALAQVDDHEDSYLRRPTRCEPPEIRKPDLRAGRTTKLARARRHQRPLRG